MYNSREVYLLKRFALILLAVFFLQLSGLRGICAPPPAEPADCCPASDSHSSPAPSSLPDCCLISVLNFQASISEVNPAPEHSEAAATVEAVQEVGFNLPRVIALAGKRVVPQSPSPPLFPLSQTCLLLI